MSDDDLLRLLGPLLAQEQPDVAHAARGVQLTLEERAEAVLKLAKLLLAHGKMGEAEAIGRHLEYWPNEQSGLDVEIAMGWLAAGDGSRALTVLNAAQASAERNDECSTRADALENVAKALLATGEVVRAAAVLERAISIAHEGGASASPQESIESMKALRAIAATLAAEGNVERARQVAASIGNAQVRGSALAAVEEIASRERQGR